MNRLISKTITNNYVKLTTEKLTFSKLPFSKFKKFVSRSVFEELQLMQISMSFKTSCCNSKFRVGKKCFWLLYYFSFEWNYDVLES